MGSGRAARLRYAYYPGCSVQGTTRESDQSLKGVAQKLGIELVEMTDANCCGSREIRAVNPFLHTVLNARILALAQGLDIVTECNTCFLNLIQVNRHLENQDALARVNRALSSAGLVYDERVRVKHSLWVLLEDVGLEALKQKVEKPLSGLRVAPFYGCHILRPASDLGFEDPDRPESLEKIVSILKAEPVEYRSRTECCGFHTLPYSETSSLLMIARALKEAKEKRADCLVTPCPLCHTALDVFQGDAEKTIQQKMGVPILHLSQLVGLALGLSPKDLMLQRHMVPVKKVIEKLGAR